MMDEPTSIIMTEVSLAKVPEKVLLLSIMVETHLPKQICSSCEREQVDIRPVANLAELQQAIPVSAYTVFYITLTASKMPPGEAQVSYTRAFHPLFRD